MDGFTPKPIKLIVIIVNRSVSKKTVKLLNDIKVTHQLAMLATGTAPTDVLSYFGLSENEKAIIMATVDAERVSDIFGKLNDTLGFDKPNVGIAFSLPINSVSTIELLKLIACEEA